MSGAYRYNRSWRLAARYGTLRRIASWFAIVALVCQVGVPFGHEIGIIFKHDVLAEDLGLKCQGLRLAAADGHLDNGTANADQPEQPSQKCRNHDDHSCPVSQLLRPAADVANAEPPALPVPAFHFERQVAYAVAAPPAADAFSRPHPRAPPLLS